MAGCLEGKDKSEYVIKFGYAEKAAQLPAIVGVEKGFFKEEMPFEATVTERGQQIIESMAAGHTDIGLASTTSVIVAVSAGAPIITVANATIGGGRMKIMAVDSSVQSVEQLKGKRIGVKIGAGTHENFVKAAELYNLKESDFKLVDIADNDLAPSLASGQVDAVSCIEPICAIIEVNGIGHEIFNFQDLDPAPIVVAANTKFIKEHPEELRKFLEVWIRTADYTEGHPDEAAAILARVNRIEEKVAVQALKYTGIEPLITPEVKKAFQDDTEFLYARGELERKPRLEDVVDDSYLIKVSGESKTATD
jgi:sulfonate transport system substrate-binding protein